MCLLWVRIMTRLINQEFISILKEATDGTKPINYITVFMGSSSCVTTEDILSQG